VLVDRVHLGAALVENVTSPEDGGVLLHGLLHVQSHVGNRIRAIRVSKKGENGHNDVRTVQYNLTSLSR
jgi:hypothetical protein